MFKSVTKIIKKARRLDTNDLLETAVSNAGVQQQMVDFNQNQMYELGVDAKGEPLGDYSPVTIHGKPGPNGFPGKIEKGQRYDHITLKDTGEFYDSMKVQVDSDSATITGDMDKPDKDLSAQWPDALGLTPESLAEVMPMIKEQTVMALKNRLFI